MAPINGNDASKPVTMSSRERTIGASSAVNAPFVTATAVEPRGQSQAAGDRRARRRQGEAHERAEDDRQREGPGQVDVGSQRQNGYHSRAPAARRQRGAIARIARGDREDERKDRRPRAVHGNAHRGAVPCSWASQTHTGALTRDEAGDTLAEASSRRRTSTTSAAVSADLKSQSIACTPTRRKTPSRTKVRDPGPPMDIAAVDVRRSAFFSFTFARTWRTGMAAFMASRIARLFAALTFESALAPLFRKSLIYHRSTRRIAMKRASSPILEVPWCFYLTYRDPTPDIAGLSDAANMPSSVATAGPFDESPACRP